MGRRSSHVIVILGAGASYDCGSPNRPPLTAGLFEGFDDVLRQYPLAFDWAPTIRGVTREGAVSLEQYLLKEMRDSANSRAQRAYVQIPLYLQHLLIERENAAFRAAHNLRQLVVEALAFDRAVFVTLNYDTLIDRLLARQSGRDIAGADDYISAGENWALIKLHGSTNWVRRINKPVTVTRGYPVVLDAFMEIGSAIPDHLSSEIEVLPLGQEPNGIDAPLQQARLIEVGAKQYVRYPAISAPLGEEDELNCPPPHLDRLHQDLLGYDNLNVLVIGYSGIDRSVLARFAKSGRPAASLQIVSVGGQDARATEERLREAGFPNGIKTVARFTHGFADWVDSGEMRAWFRSLRDA